MQARAQRHAAWQHQRDLKGAVAAAEDAFRSKDYALVVRLLAPFEAELDKIWASKLSLARKKG